MDVVVTYMHLKSTPKVKKGDKVSSSTLLGYYGNTGANTTGPHLHIQFDTDTDYPLYCCGLSKKGHSLLKKGTVDSTVNPIELFHIGEGQDISVPSSAWYDKDDFLEIPIMPKETPVESSIKEEPVDSKKLIKIIEKTARGITTFRYVHK